MKELVCLNPHLVWKFKPKVPSFSHSRFSTRLATNFAAAFEGLPSIIWFAPAFFNHLEVPETQVLFRLENG
jgi:hypothetical protein